MMRGSCQIQPAKEDAEISQGVTAAREPTSPRRKENGGLLYAVDSQLSSRSRTGSLLQEKIEKEQGRLQCRGCGLAITDDELSCVLGEADRYGLSFEDCESMVWYCNTCFPALIQRRAPTLPSKVERTNAYEGRRRL